MGKVVLARGNNPIKYVDPDGNWVQFAVGAGVGFISGAFIQPAMEDWKESHLNRNYVQEDIVSEILDYANENSITDLDAATTLYNFEQLGIDKGENHAENMDSYHEQGGQSGNDKYVLEIQNSNASYELIFDENGKLVTNPVNRGTYNFCDADKSGVGHFFQDVVPYWLWGNDDVDAATTSTWERITGTYTGDISEGVSN